MITSRRLAHPTIDFLRSVLQLDGHARFDRFWEAANAALSLIVAEALVQALSDYGYLQTHKLSVAVARRENALPIIRRTCIIIYNGSSPGRRLRSVRLSLLIDGRADVRRYQVQILDLTSLF